MCVSNVIVCVCVCVFCVCVQIDSRRVNIHTCNTSLNKATASAFAPEGSLSSGLVRGSCVMVVEG